MPERITIPVLRLKQKEWDIYVGKIQAKDVFFISKADRLRLKELKIPRYAGFQRPLNEKRVDEIRDYLTTPRAIFPNSIIVTLDSENIVDWTVTSKDPEYSHIEIVKEEGVFIIIDGQHRVAALSEIVDESFELLVTIFIDLDINDCAEIFAKINSTQKAVNPSIAYQLFGYSESRSPQKTAHEIAFTMNSTHGSPFYKKLKMMGSKDDWTNGTLSQATFAKYLMKLYTKNPTRDENSILRGEKLEDDASLPLRKHFINNNDKEMLAIIWKYFLNVAKTWPDQWNDPLQKSILTKTTGFSSFIEVLVRWLRATICEEVYKDRGAKERFNSIKAFFEAADHKFIRENYPAGNQGVVMLRDILFTKLDLDKE